MQKERDALRLGIVTVIVVAIVFFLLIWISKDVGGDLKSVDIFFQPTPAMPMLTTGSAVYIGGQKIGQVVEAELLPPDHDRNPSSKSQSPQPFVYVRAEIQKWITLREDCSAFAEGPPLGGDGIIKIDLGTAAGVWTEGKPLMGAEPGGFAAVLTSLQAEFDANNPDSLLGQIKAQLDPEGDLSLIAKLHQSLTDINAMTGALSRELGPAEKATLLAKIHEIVDNINETTHQLRGEFDAGESTALLRKIHLAMDAVNDGLSTVSRIVRTGEGSISNTLVNIEKTTEHISEETDPTRADSLIAHFKQASEKINASLGDLNTVTSTTRDIVVLNRENINRLLMNFKESSDHIKAGVKYLVRNPWRMLNAPKPEEMKQQAIFDAARSFTEAATRIDDASAQLRALSELHEGSIPLDDPDLARIRANLKSTHDKYQKAEAEMWRQLGG
ncbi:MAG: hypothetical protein ACE5EC_01015 [Phycisphaerae bacterium]